MSITARAEYACLAMMELAARSGSTKLIPLSDLADRHDIPARFLVQILLQMKAAGLVTSTRGASGGYLLARSPDRISLGDIFRAMEAADSSGSSLPQRSPYSRALREVWRQLSQARLSILNSITLADLLKSGADVADYVI